MPQYDQMQDVTRFIYSPKEDDSDEAIDSIDADKDVPKEIMERLLTVIGREVLRERTPTLQELEQDLQEAIAQNLTSACENKNKFKNSSAEQRNLLPGTSIPLVKALIQTGYLKDDPRWLSSKAFVTIGGKILRNVMQALKTDDFGLHETNHLGNGSLILDTTRKYETGNDIKLLNVPASLLNAVQRIARHEEVIKVPISVSADDLEEYETVQDVRVGVVYCIDLSSTMRYSSMYGDLSRIEAAKRALWSLVLLNRKFFPSDSIYVIGFGALASRVKICDIPYLKTFEPGSDFLHYTNYQAAFRLASKLLQKCGATNKRIVLITDGHPSACFIDNKKEQNKIMSQRPYSHFYIPNDEVIESVRKIHGLSLDVSSGELVYLCYRYKQVDQYVAEKTISEAKKCHQFGIEIDTIMISEEDSLLGYVNEMEKYIKGRSYYINPGSIDIALLNDYLYNRRVMITSSGLS